MSVFDPYQPGDSPVHQIDPRVRIVLTLGFILCVALMPSGAFTAYGLAGVIFLLVAIKSRLGVRLYLTRGLLSLPFMLAAVPLLWTTPGDAAWAVSLPFTQIAITTPGLIKVSSILIKAWLSVEAAVLLSATTPIPELLAGLQALKVPPTLVSIAGFMLRYLHVLTDEASRLLRARASRSPGKPAAGIAWRAQVAGGMAGSLILRSMERSERVYAAMLARGYNGRLPDETSRSIPASDLRLLTIGILFLIIMLIFANTGWLQ